MEIKSRLRCSSLWALLLVLHLLLAANEMGGVEGRVCQSQSHGFHGTCLSNHNCALVCRNEGFSGGRCGGHLPRRCYCTKLC